MTTRFCPDCREQRPVEQPPCLDRHAECPEWACVECGCAIVAGWLEIDAPAAPTAGSVAA
jgi:hypothetical protein